MGPCFAPNGAAPAAERVLIEEATSPDAETRFSRPGAGPTDEPLKLFP